MRVHGTARAKNVWRHAREGADSVHTGVNVYAYTQNGRTDIPAMDPGPIVMVAHLRVAARVALSCWVCLAVGRMSDYVLSRGGVVDEKTVSRSPRRVAWGYDFTSRVLLGSLMMGCRSERWAKGEGETDATGDGIGAGTGGW